MSRSNLSSSTLPAGDKRIKLWTVWVLRIVTVALSVALFYLLPGLAGPALAVFIPTLAVAAALVTIVLTRGRLGLPAVLPEDVPVGR